MRHQSIIQTEFLKEARKWDELSLDEQKDYLHRHPKSKRRITAKPAKAESKVKPVEEMLGAKTLHTRLKRLDNYVEKHHLNRTKIYWALKSVLNNKKPRYGYTPNEVQLDTLVRKLAESVKKLGNRHHEGYDSALKYIKHKFTIDRQLQTAPKSKKDITLSRPKKSKVVKSDKTPDQMMIGHRIKFTSKKGPVVEGTITGINPGRKHTKISVETDDGQHWWLKRSGTNYVNSNVKYIGKTTSKDTTRLRKNRIDFDIALSDQKQEKVDDDRDKISQLGIGPGDTISIRGPHYNWHAQVIDIDYKKGGVRIDQQRTRRQRGDYLAGIPGTVTTHYRFIPARSIVDKIN